MKLLVPTVRFLFLAASIAFAFLGTSSQATPRADAEYIAEQTVTRAIFEAALSANKSVIVSAFQNNLRSKGVTLPDPDRLFDLLMEEFVEEFTLTMQDQTAALYVKKFSSEQLAEIAEFYKTDTGQAVIKMVPVMMREGARMGQLAGQRAGANAGKRLAKRIEAEGLIVIDDPSMLSRLIDALK